MRHSVGSLRAYSGAIKFLIVRLILHINQLFCGREQLLVQVNEREQMSSTQGLGK